MSLSEAVLMIADQMDDYATTLPGPYLGKVKNFTGQLRVAVKAAAPVPPGLPKVPPWGLPSTGEEDLEFTPNSPSNDDTAVIGVKMAYIGSGPFEGDWVSIPPSAHPGFTIAVGCRNHTLNADGNLYADPLPDLDLPGEKDESCGSCS